MSCEHGKTDYCAECAFIAEHYPVQPAPSVPGGEDTPRFDFVAALREAQQIVREKYLWKRFIAGTPLSNDIAVWMTDFAAKHVREAAARIAAPLKRVDCFDIAPGQRAVRVYQDNCHPRESPAPAPLAECSELDDERHAHDEIATLIHRAGFETPDGTSLSGVRELLKEIARLRAERESATPAPGEFPYRCACGDNFRMAQEMRDHLEGVEGAHASVAVPGAALRALAEKWCSWEYLSSHVSDSSTQAFVQAANELEALAAHPPEGREWQPIETAPKDEDVLLLYLDGSGVQPGYWDGDQWVACETQGLTGGGWHSEPTHWMPLPDPPAVSR